MLPSRPLSSHPRGSSTSHCRSSASRSGAVRSIRRKCSSVDPVGDDDHPIIRHSQDAHRAGSVVCGDGQDAVAALSSRPQPVHPIPGIPPRRRQFDSFGAAVLLDLLQHQQLSPVEVRHHRHVRKDLSRGIVQWREVVEVENHRGERTQPEPAGAATSPPAAWPALVKHQRECGPERRACPHTTHAAAPAGPTGPRRAARHPLRG